MITPRIIPCLLLDDNKLIKGIKFKNHRYIGDPMNAIKIFSEKGADELILLDTTATKKQRPMNIERIERIADECYMPFGIGGGIQTIEQIRLILRAGAEKVIINTEATHNTKLIYEASHNFGKQSIVISIDVKQRWNRKYQVFSHCGKKPCHLDLLSYVKEIEDQGAGEIMITLIDRDGTMKGYDIDLVSKIANLVSIPVIAGGGAGCIDDINHVIDKGDASAAAVGSLFVFHGKKKGILISYPKRNNV